MLSFVLHRLGRFPYLSRRQMDETPLHNKPQNLEEFITSEQQAFTQVYQEYRPLLFAQALRLLKIKQAAEDVCNDVFANLWQNRETLHHIQSIKAYLLTAVRNRGLNALKAMARSQSSLAEIRRHFADKSLSAEEQFLDKEYFSFIRQQTDRLPARAKEVFGLCREEGLSYEQVSSKLGISRNAVKGHMVSSMKKLKGLAEKELDLSFLLLLFFLL